MDPERTRRFEALARPNMAAAYNLALWMTRNPADAEDVVQDALLRALRFFDGYRGGDARAWLLQIVRNTARTWLSSRPATTAGSEAGPEQWEDPGERSNDPAELVVAMADAHRLRELVASLPVDYREVLILREFEGLSYREIATVVSAPLGTVMSRLARARDRLAASLKAAEGVVP